MRFAFTDDQLAFRDAVRELLEKECPPSVVRAAWDERRTGAPDRAGTRSARWACSARSRRSPPAGSGSRSSTSCSSPKRPAGPRCPSRSSSTCWSARRSSSDSLRTVTAALGPSPAVRVRRLRRRCSWSRTTTVCCSSTRAALLVEPRPSVDTPGTSRRWTGMRRGRRVRGRRTEALALAFDRGALGTAAQLLGLAAALLDTTVEYVGAAAAVRGADRVAAGDQAQARGRPRRARVRPAARLPGRLRRQQRPLLQALLRHRQRGARRGPEAARVRRPARRLRAALRRRPAPRGEGGDLGGRRCRGRAPRRRRQLRQLRRAPCLRPPVRRAPTLEEEATIDELTAASPKGLLVPRPRARGCSPSSRPPRIR